MDGRKVKLTWEQPTGFYTHLKIEKCTQAQCIGYPVPSGATEYKLDDNQATYRLVVYQHSQMVQSENFVDDYSIDGKLNQI